MLLYVDYDISVVHVGQFGKSESVTAQCVVAEQIRTPDSSSRFLLSKVWVRTPVDTLVSLKARHFKTIIAASLGWDVKPYVMCVVLMHVNELCALIEKRRGSPGYSWFDRRHTEPQHLVNHYRVLDNVN